jgi:BolA protein
MGPIESNIQTKLASLFSPSEFQLVNESSSHSGPGTETHFKVFLVSDKFKDLNRVKRQQAVYAALAEELEGPVHALSMRLLTPEEWSEQNKADMPDSPDCRGGSKI